MGDGPSNITGPTLGELLFQSFGGNGSNSNVLAKTDLEYAARNKKHSSQKGDGKGRFRKLSAAEFGKIIGWGTTQESAGQAASLARSMTAQKVQSMIDKGLTKNQVQGVLRQLEESAQDPLKVSGNQTLLPRVEVLKSILTHWPK